MKTFQQLQLLLMLFVILPCTTVLVVAADNPTMMTRATAEAEAAAEAAAAAAAEEEEPTTEEEEEDDTHPYYAVLLPWFSIAIGICVFYCQTRYFHLVPYTCVMFLVGLCMGVGEVRSGLEDQLTESIAQWTSINHQTLFLVFLPGLLMKDAMELNFHLFLASFWQLIILAFPVVLAGTVLTALVAYYIFPYDWSWALCLTFGSILSATDPVAVCALLNELGAPPRLKMLISGEALLNDGSAVVFYVIFSALFLYQLDIEGLGSTTSVADGFIIFFRMALGGTAVGIAFGLALVLILFFLDRRFEKEEAVMQVAATVTMAYLSFYTSDVVCHMSGVIAVVMCGVVTSAFGHVLISDWVIMDSFWSLLENLLNTVIFTLGGIEFGNIIANPGGNWTGKDWGFLFLLFAAVNGIRFFLLAVSYPVYSRIGLGTNWQEMIFSSWAGLRGALGIALALGLNNAVRGGTDDPDKTNITNKVFGMVGGIAFLTLTINAPLSAPLLEKLGLIDSTEARKSIVQQVEAATRRRMLDDFLHLMTDPRFYFVDFALVMYHCAPLRDLTAKELEGAVEMNRASVHPDQYKAPNIKHVLPYVPNSTHLRWVCEKAARDMFMDPSSVTDAKLSGKSFFDLESVGAGGEDAAPKETPNKDIINSIRLMFIELLRASYQRQIQDGELDPREFNGYLSYVLLQSLEFAHDAAQNGEPLDDWNWSTGLSSPLLYKSQDLAARVYGCCCVKRKGHNKKVEAGGDSSAKAGGTGRDSSAEAEGDGPLTHGVFKTAISMAERLGALDDSNFKRQQLRLDVLRAFSFIDAHSEAGDRLNEEFGDGPPDTKSAFRVVMEESRAQVRNANAVLNGKNQKELKYVISHYLCVILQNKYARYVKLLLDSGVLLQREARHYLDEIDHSIIDIRSRLMEEYPGTIVLEEEEEGKTTRKMRTRRVKQKSLF